MLKIEDGRLSFYQWDLNQRLVIDNPSIIEVHYTNALTSPALVCEVYEENGIRYANVPNILLQTDWTIKAYGCCDDYVIEAETFIVNTREKPADYVYTETEIKRYDDLEKRIDNLEQGGSGEVDLTNYYTKKETDTALAGKLDNAPDTWPVWTDVEQAAARANVGAASQEVVSKLSEENAEIKDDLAKLDGKYELIEKIIVGYTLTISEPSDWTTNYTNYFRNTGSVKEPVYTAVSGESAPIWESGTYYSYDSEFYGVVRRTADTDGIPYNFKGLSVQIVSPSNAITGNLYVIGHNQGNFSYGSIVLEHHCANGVAANKWFEAVYSLNFNYLWTGVYNSNYDIHSFVSRKYNTLTNETGGNNIRSLQFGEPSYQKAGIIAGTTIKIYGVRA